MYANPSNNIFIFASQNLLRVSIEIHKNEYKRFNYNKILFFSSLIFILKKLVSQLSQLYYVVVRDSKIFDMQNSIT